MTVNILDIYRKGQAKIASDYTENEKHKSGCLRAGQTGMMDEEGNIANQCAAQAWLRSRGVEYSPPDEKTVIMFDGGNANEDAWMKVLVKGWDGKILCEEETPTVWETSNGTRVTGRPDILLCDKEGNGVKGIELKQCMSLWSVTNMLFKKVPKTAHLLQAAHYSWQLGVPFELWYTGRSNFAVMEWQKWQLPKYQQPGSEHLEYGYYRKGDINPRTKKHKKHRISKEEYEMAKGRSGVTVYADPLKTRPFIQGFHMELREGQLYYKDAMVEDAEWIRTEVSIDRIKRFYTFVSEMDKVPSEPLNISPTGEKESFKLRDYCSLGPLCCAYNKGKDINKWEEQVKLFVKEKKESTDK